MPRNIFVVLWAAAMFVLAAGCAKAPPANVAATVNGRPVTYAELEKQFQIQFPPSGGIPGQNSPGAPANDDQVQFQKLEILRGLIDNEIMLQRAEKANLLATDADVDAKLNELKAPYTQEEFQRQLNLRKMSLDDLKAQLRRDLSVQKLFNKEITSNINITDKDVANFYAANQKSFNLTEPQIHLAQILVTPNADPNVRNLKNDKAMNDDQARRKADTLLARIRQGEDFAQLAQNYSEDPQTLGTGGDLGFVPQSALDRANPELRKLVLSIPIGQVSGVIKTQEGYRIFKVLAKQPAGQREPTDPNVQQQIRETLINRKDQLLRSAYIEVARNDAKVVNYLARSIAPGQEKK